MSGRASGTADPSGPAGAAPETAGAPGAGKAPATSGASGSAPATPPAPGATAAPDRRAAALATLREEFGCLLGAERRLRGRDQHRKVEGDLTIAQVRALFALDARAGATAGEIAEAARLSPASVTGMLDELERDGIVVRERSEGDRRRVLVTLTDEGRAVLGKRRRRWLQRWEAAMEDVPERDLEAAAEAMGRIATLLDNL
ncbi:MAG TPA: MarR family transcriptional regulator [Solirubrobacterales bacterium]|nr:MarR family transcriptional regulator [Solirubrobacterales bacterium]